MKLSDEADFVIIGTGAGGATAARVLAASGCSVVMLEEGPWLTREDRPRDLLRAMGAAVRHFGTQATVGSTPIPLLQGRLVGGSTAINSGIIWRMPEDVRRQWIDEHGLARRGAGARLRVGRIERAAEAREVDLSFVVLQREQRAGQVAVLDRQPGVSNVPGAVHVHRQFDHLERAELIDGDRIVILAQRAQAQRVRPLGVGAREPIELDGEARPLVLRGGDGDGCGLTYHDLHPPVLRALPQATAQLRQQRPIWLEEEPRRCDRKLGDVAPFEQGVVELGRRSAAAKQQPLGHRAVGLQPHFAEQLGR